MIPHLPWMTTLAVSGVALAAGLFGKPFGQWSGIERLVAEYTVAALPAVGQLRGRTVQVGAVRFRRCTTVVVAQEGLYLHVRSVFASYSPICLPWTALAPAGQTFIYWEMASRYQVATQPPVFLALTGEAGRLVRARMTPK